MTHMIPHVLSAWPSGWPFHRCRPETYSIEYRIFHSGFSRLRYRYSQCYRLHTARVGVPTAFFHDMLESTARWIEFVFCTKYRVPKVYVVMGDKQARKVFWKFLAEKSTPEALATERSARKTHALLSSAYRVVRWFLNRCSKISSIFSRKHPITLKIQEHHITQPMTAYPVSSSTFPRYCFLWILSSASTSANCGPFHLGSHSRRGFTNPIFRQKPMNRSKQIEIRWWILQCIKRVESSTDPHHHHFLALTYNVGCWWKQQLRLFHKPIRCEDAFFKLLAWGYSQLHICRLKGMKFTSISRIRSSAQWTSTDVQWLLWSIAAEYVRQQYIL